MKNGKDALWKIELKCKISIVRNRLVRGRQRSYLTGTNRSKRWTSINVDGPSCFHQQEQWAVR